MKRWLALSLVAASGRLADYLTTAYGLANGFVERNPYACVTLHCQLAAAIALAAALYTLERAEKTAPVGSIKVAARLAAVCIAVYSWLPPLHNLSLIFLVNLRP